jgi:hypothetical protein
VNGIRGVGQAIAMAFALLLSLFLTVDRASAEPVPTATHTACVRAERAERTEVPPKDSPAHRQYGGMLAVLPGSLSIGSPSPTMRTGSAADGLATTDDDDVSAAVAAPHAAGPAVSRIRRSGELPVVLQTFRC